MTGLIARLRSLWRGIRRRGDLEVDMNDEFRLHRELRADDLMRTGLSPAAAGRQARLEFGSAERYKDEGRASRGLRLFDGLRVSMLDFKLGVRMLVKYPGLTLVGGLAIAFAIWLGAATFEVLTRAAYPTLPLDDGDRIVGIRLWHSASSSVEEQILHDFAAWRGRLETVEDLGAFRTRTRNLVADGSAEPVMMAYISASAFRLTRIPPLLGRGLVDADEAPHSPPVIVIGFDVWRRLFGSDSNVVGRTVRLADVPSTIVGVMPEGYAFPVAHGAWVPLRLEPLDYGPRRGPAANVFGRLARGVTLESAQAELTALGVRAAADFPDTHEHIRPQVMPYAQSVFWYSAVGVMSINLLLVMLLVLVYGNVALLMFARAATREGEIVVRTALGASRGRIITQFFAEALVLGAAGAIVGLAAVGVAMRWGLSAIEIETGPLPFWFNDRLSPATVLYAAGLTVLGAMIAGVVPALKVTRGVEPRLRQMAAGGGGLRFGGIWTAVIVAQVAVTVAFPAVAFFVRRDAVQIRSVEVGFPAEEYLAVQLEMDRESAPGTAVVMSPAAFSARFQATRHELERRLVTEAGVVGVTVADVLPRMYHGWNQIELDAGALVPSDSARGHRVSRASIEPGYFDVLGTPVLAGRPFNAGDVASGAQVVIVNQPFVDLVLGGRNPIGRRVRYIASGSDPVPTTDGPWYDIIGAAPDIGMISGYGRAGIYHAMPRDTYPLRMAVHVKGDDPESFAPRLRAIATGLDPSLRLSELQRLDRVNAAELRFLAFWFQLTAVVGSVALLLSLAGIFAVMSFAVARRTREIGIRVALGADRRRIIAAVFAGPLKQVGLGIGAGAGLVAALVFAIYGSTLGASHVGLVLAYAALMLGVCLLACIVPTRRALRVEPTEALRVDV